MRRTIVNGLLCWSLASATQVAAKKFDKHAQSLLDRSMDFMDGLYDPDAGYLFGFDTALLHETRSSSWYAVGLLARNHEDDRNQALRIIDNIIEGQFTNASEQWYGDYQVYPEEPSPGTKAYPAEIYDTWDPNWRGFIGTAFIIILEEFSELIDQKMQDRIVRSLHLAAVGDTYRVGGVDDDNLYPSYSNAAIMHATLSAYVGQRTGDKNLTAEGEKWANEIVSLFDLNQTLSEFNSPTYVGISLYALTLWAKYFPEDSALGANGGRMITQVWELTTQLYNANMKNIAGPWDRSYGYDMKQYLSVVALFIWSLIGIDEAPLYARNPAAMAHSDDFEIGPLVAVLSAFNKQFLSEAALARLTQFEGTNLILRSAYSPPYDHTPRNVSTWMSANLTIGAESFDENVVGGPSVNPLQFNPAVVQWLREDGSTGFITLYPETQAMQADVSERRLELAYPYGNDTSKFTLHVSPNGLFGPKNVRSLSDIAGIDVKVSGSVDPEPKIAFCGAKGGTCDPVNEFDLWNITYFMRPGDTKVPNIVLDFELQLD